MDRPPLAHALFTLFSGMAFVCFAFFTLLAMATHHRVTSALTELGMLLAAYGMARILQHGTKLDSQVPARDLRAPSGNST